MLLTSATMDIFSSKRRNTRNLFNWGGGVETTLACATAIAGVLVSTDPASNLDEVRLSS